MISYFKSYGIRVECALTHSKSGPQGWIGELKLYCPSKFSKETLSNTVHLVHGCFVEFFDPVNTLMEKERPYVLEPTFSEILSFNSRSQLLP